MPSRKKDTPPESQSVDSTMPKRSRRAHKDIRLTQREMLERLISHRVSGYMDARNNSLKVGDIVWYQPSPLRLEAGGFLYRPLMQGIIQDFHIQDDGRVKCKVELTHIGGTPIPKGRRGNPRWPLTSTVIRVGHSKE